MEIKYEKIRLVKSPTRSHDTDAGVDIYIPDDLGWNKKWIGPNRDILVPSGLKLFIPNNWCAVFLNKSGVAWHNKLILGAQVVDAGYTGEVHLHLINHSKGDIIIKAGQKIAQFLILPVPSIKLKQVKNYDKETTRGERGFGSTGNS